MIEERAKTNTIVKRIKKMLFNYDLAVAYVKGEIKIREANMRLYKGDTKKISKRKFVLSKVEKERYEIFLEEIAVAKKEILENLNLILDKYQPRYRQVFVAYFLEDKQYCEIEALTNYSYDAIKAIIRRLKNDLIDLYVP